jgi:hypothetical protein
VENINRLRPQEAPALDLYILYFIKSMTNLICTPIYMTHGMTPSNTELRYSASYQSHGCNFMVQLTPHSLNAMNHYDSLLVCALLARSSLVGLIMLQRRCEFDFSNCSLRLSYGTRVIASKGSSYVVLGLWIVAIFLPIEPQCHCSSYFKVWSLYE